MSFLASSGGGGGSGVSQVFDRPYMRSGVPIVARSASLSAASVIVRTDGAAVFQLRYVRGATCTPADLHSRDGAIVNANTATQPLGAT